MEFAAFAERVDEIEREPSDLGTVGLLAALLADADALATVARFVQGRVFPAHDGRKLSVGSATLHETIARAAAGSVTAADVEDRLATVGEIGAVAADYEFGAQTGLGSFGGGSTEPLTVEETQETFAAVADAEGDGSADTRSDLLFGLFNRADPTEAKYLARLVSGEMRIGVGAGAVRDAVAEAFLDGVETTETRKTDGAVEDEEAAASLDQFAEDNDDATKKDDDIDDEENTDTAVPTADPSTAAVAAVERAIQVTNDAGRVAVVARDEGRAGLAELGLEVGRPVESMLAQAGTVSETLSDWETAVVETKFDGARVQVHAAPDGDGGLAVRVFSRNLEDVTDALPEVVEHAQRHLAAPAILDGEVVAVDDDGEPLPFQAVLRRFRRKHDVRRVREEVAVEFHAFDCLHVGEPFDAGAFTDAGLPSAPPVDLLDAPLRERRVWLEAVLAGGVATATETADAAEIERLEREALAAGHEGLLLKRPQSTYDPGDRGADWRKRKPDVETLDLVVTGAEWGEGRRANLLGTFEVSVATGSAEDGSAASGEYAPVGKVATGFTDEALERLTERLEPAISETDGQTVTVEPTTVLEVGYEEIQTSPEYDAGYALRFPRFLGVRDDLGVADADTRDRVERLADEQ